MLGEVLQRACNGTGSPSARHCLPPPPSSAMPSPALPATPAPSSAMPCLHPAWPSLMSPVSCLPLLPSCLASPPSCLLSALLSCPRPAPVLPFPVPGQLLAAPPRLAPSQRSPSTLAVLNSFLPSCCLSGHLLSRLSGWILVCVYVIGSVLCF